MYIQDSINWVGLPRKILLWALVYSILYPITYLAGGTLATIGNLFAFPFLPAAWIISKGFVFLFGSGTIYLFGLAFGILVQIVLIAMYSKKCFYLKTREKCMNCVLPKITLFALFIFFATVSFYLILFTISYSLSGR